jgi:hypothetical protein
MTSPILTVDGDPLPDAVIAGDDDQDSAHDILEYVLECERDPGTDDPVGDEECGRLGHPDAQAEDEYEDGGEERDDLYGGIAGLHVLDPPDDDHAHDYGEDEVRDGEDERGQKEVRDEGSSVTYVAAPSAADTSTSMTEIRTCRFMRGCHRHALHCYIDEPGMERRWAAATRRTARPQCLYR